MPQSPNSKYSFENNNTRAITPSLGVSHVVAITTKGNFNQPDEVISTFSQFQELYGQEVVPDGSVSNIERAFSLSSKLRVSRVGGSGEVSKGIASTYDPASKVVGSKATLKMTMQNPADVSEMVTFGLSIQTREYGSSIVKPSEPSANRPFFLRVYSKLSGTSIKYYLDQFISYNENNAPEPTSQIASTLMLNTTSGPAVLIDAQKPSTVHSEVVDGGKPSSYSGSSSSYYTDVTSFENFLTSVPNLEFVLESSSENNIVTISDMISLMKANSNWVTYLDTNSSQTETQKTIADYHITEGSNGNSSSTEQWLAAYDALRDYTDGYQLVLSHIHQHLPNDYPAIYRQVGIQNQSDFESVLYVEVPKNNIDGSPMKPAEIVSKTLELQEIIGKNKSTAYFSGGLKFRNLSGTLLNNDVLGTVMGIGDSSATKYGPYYSLAGMNRGLVTDSSGPVTTNLGSPARYETLNDLAEVSQCLFVIKDHPTLGKQTMLWHNFTSSMLDNSDKFLSSVRLQLFLKKNIRPIIDLAIEEPNYIPTWETIYYKAKKILDSLVNIAYSEYEWLGDQGASGYSDMIVNKEIDVRAGKYKAIMKYKDIVSLQWVEIVFSVDTTGSSQTIN